MKFTRSKAVEKLTAYLTNNGKKPLRMSEKSLGEQTDDLMALLDDDEMELDAFVDKVKGQFSRFNSNVEHDVSEGLKAALAQQKPEQEPKSDPEDKDKGGNPELKALMDRLDALEKERTEREARSIADSKRKEVRNYLKEKKVSEDWIDNILDLVPLDKDSEVETVGDSLLGRYNKMLAGDGGNITPGTPTGSTESKTDFSDIASIRKQSQSQS